MPSPGTHSEQPSPPACSIPTTSLGGVFVLSNTLSLRRPEGWTDEALDNASETIRTFFIVYDENKPPGAMEEPEVAEAAEETAEEAEAASEEG